MPEVVVDDRPEEIRVAGLLRLGQARLHLVALKAEQPGELLRTRQEMLSERFQTLVRKELDELGNAQAGRVAIERVHQADRGSALGMPEGEINGGRTARVMADRNYLVDPQGLNDRFQVTKLLFETIMRALGLVGGAEAQKVDRDGSTTGRSQMRNQVVVDV
ncbi:MAG: hypothetical protein WDN69_35275 [Aliidongia sp.]